MNPNTGGPAFPIADTYHPNGQIQFGSCGMTLLDWMAGQETLADWDNPDAIIPKELAQHFGGDMPEGGWSKNPIAAFERDARVRAGMRYTRASAMLAEKARRETVVLESSTTDHFPDATKMIPGGFAEDTLRRLATDVLHSDIKDAAEEAPLTWCAEQVRARVNTLRVVNMELAQVLGEVIDWDGYSIESANSLQRARAAISKSKEVS